ncbi:MAG: 3-isopropylmalate dehydratase large subunit [Acidiferrobacterales bacterium]|nr:3-isopropylmalate dehydratase large subunit [Acidiferrobacterales bacterium]
MTSTLFDKIWAQHTVTDLQDNSTLLYVDRVFLHERTGSIALKSLEEKNRQVAKPENVFCTMDHIIDTFPGRNDDTLMPSGKEFILSTRQAAKKANIRLFDINDSDQGISHLVSAEQGITLPGLTVVCPDSHTCTLGALGAMAWGIGSTECEHALSTQTLHVTKPRQVHVQFHGELKRGVTAKDMILYLISEYGSHGAKGMAIEFSGSAIDKLNMDSRFTLCNMATEFSAFTAIIAPDKTTFEYIKGRQYAPSGELWKQGLADWALLRSDPDAVFDKEIVIDCADIAPMVSWGTSPEHSIAIDETLKLKGNSQPESVLNAIKYIDIDGNESLLGKIIDGVFIGSCTNGRLSDLIAAGEILKGHKVKEGVKAICTPGSAWVKKSAEKIGLDKVFKTAGFEWREPGCSLCFYAGGEGFESGQRVVSTTNRNFKGRQGPGVRTHITSPYMAAAAAIEGCITDCRKYL